MIIMPDYFHHPKTAVLEGFLGPMAALYPLRLWAYCDTSSSGELPKDAHMIRAICKARQDGHRLIEALITAGFVDVFREHVKVDRPLDGNTVENLLRNAQIRLVAHEWESYNARLLASRSNAKRPRRAAKSGASVGSGEKDGAETGSESDDLGLARPQLDRSQNVASAQSSSSHEGRWLAQEGKVSESTPPAREAGLREQMDGWYRTFLAANDNCGRVTLQAFENLVLPYVREGADIDEALGAFTRQTAGAILMKPAHELEKYLRRALADAEKAGPIGSGDRGVFERYEREAAGAAAGRSGE